MYGLFLFIINLSQLEKRNVQNYIKLTVRFYEIFLTKFYIY